MATNCILLAHLPALSSYPFSLPTSSPLDSNLAPSHHFPFDITALFSLISYKQQNWITWNFIDKQEGEKVKRPPLATWVWVTCQVPQRQLMLTTIEARSEKGQEEGDLLIQRKKLGEVASFRRNHVRAVWSAVSPPSTRLSLLTLAGSSTTPWNMSWSSQLQNRNLMDRSDGQLTDVEC